LKKKRRDQHGDERRKAQVEVNLLAESEGSGRVITKARRGCALPFFGTGVFLILIEAVRTGLG
jgi:hypothetical protein